MAMGGARLFFGLCVLLGCAAQPRAVHEPTPATEPEPLGCTQNDEPLCAQPLSRVVIDDLASRGLAPKLADREEVCRRLAIDTLGRAPTPVQLHRCRTEPYEETVDAWLASDAHAQLRRGIWFAMTAVQAGYGWDGHVEDFEDLVDAVAKQTISYETFVSRLVLHPAFYQRHPGDDWFRAIYDVFLGRSARQDEVVGLGPLLSIWSQRSGYVGRSYASEIAFDLCNCPTDGHACVSETLGTRIDMRGGACTNKRLLTRGRLIRLVDVTIDPAEPGDQLYANRQMAGPPSPATDEERERLEQFPRALIARPDFWEHAIDRELERLLGWWHTTFVVADSDIPEVRRMLLETLEETGSLRDVERAILTSVLYRMSAFGDDADEDVVQWANGPRKMMSGVAWANTASMALGAPYEMCPPVGTQANPYGYRGSDPYTVLCSSPLALAASPATLDAQRELANRICAKGDDVLPDDFDPAEPTSLEDAARHLVRTLLGRRATSAEMHGLAADMDACVHEGGDALFPDDTGCDTEETAVRWTCTRILNSAEYGTY